MRTPTLMCMQAPTQPAMLPILPPLLNFNFDDLALWRARQKVVVVMGATGTGKSRLSVDLATRFSGEVINCDKMQVYEGLPILTNKLTDTERHGIPHHLLGTISASDTDFTAEDFRDSSTHAVASVAGRGRLPIIAGGSNSFIEELVDGRPRRGSSPLQYEFRFIWLDVSAPVLHSSVSERVDRMVELGLVDEAREAFDPAADYSRGIRRSIGLPELDGYFRAEKSSADSNLCAKLLREAIEEIKKNTCQLARRQTEKIQRLGCLKGWKLHRIDATAVFLKRAAGCSGEEAEAAWEESVVAPSALILRQFLNDDFSGNPAGVSAPWRWNKQPPSSGRLTVSVK